MEINAEAEAEVMRRKARGEADAIFAKMDAEARGSREVLAKQAEGMKLLVEAAGSNADSAVKLIIADKLEELTKIQVEAIKNIKIDKVTVWDSNGNADNGKTATANFLSGIMKSIPPMNELFKQAGMELPEYLGTDLEEADQKKIEEAIAAYKEKMAEKQEIIEATAQEVKEAQQAAKA